jgi:hypothetical protein
MKRLAPNRETMRSIKMVVEHADIRSRTGVRLHRNPIIPSFNRRKRHRGIRQAININSVSVRAVRRRSHLDMPDRHAIAALHIQVRMQCLFERDVGDRKIGNILPLHQPRSTAGQNISAPINSPKPAEKRICAFDEHKFRLLDVAVVGQQRNSRREHQAFAVDCNQRAVKRIQLRCRKQQHRLSRTSAVGQCCLQPARVISCRWRRAVRRAELCRQHRTDCRIPRHREMPAVAGRIRLRPCG